ncbi:MAG TPA: PKD domain-containing protein [Bacteroidetes bacterium]|nr:PKD domain-containing protein [Bacteroidota bacterium]
MKKTTLLFALFAMLAFSGYSQMFCNAQFSVTNQPSNPSIFSFTDMSTSSDSIVSWSWTFGDGNTSVLANPNHTYMSGNGPWIACLTITTASNCTSTFCDSVAYSNTISCTASMTDSTVGAVTVFSATASGSGIPVGYYWDFGDGNNTYTTGSTTSHTYAFNGSYLASVAVDFSDSCRALASVNVSISGAAATCNANFYSSVSSLSATVIDASTSSGAINSWSWDMGDGTVLTSGSTVSHTYASAGTYLVCLTINTVDSCSSSFCDSVVVGSSQGGPCQASFIHYPDTTGQYTIIGINTSTGPSLSYAWDFGDGGTSTAQYPTHQYAGAGTYLICLTVTSGPQCTSTFCDSVTVINKVNAPFTISFQSTATAVAPALSAQSLEIFPNPASDLVNLRLNIDTQADVSLQMMNIEGRSIMQMDAGSLGAGEHTLSLETATLPSGLYLVRVQVGNQQITKKLMVRN